MLGLNFHGLQKICSKVFPLYLGDLLSPPTSTLAYPTLALPGSVKALRLVPSTTEVTPWMNLSHVTPIHWNSKCLVQEREKGLAMYFYILGRDIVQAHLVAA